MKSFQLLDHKKLQFYFKGGFIEKNVCWRLKSKDTVFMWKCNSHRSDLYFVLNIFSKLIMIVIHKVFSTLFSNWTEHRHRAEIAQISKEIMKINMMMVKIDCDHVSQSFSFKLNWAQASRWDGPDLEGYPENKKGQLSFLQDSHRLDGSTKNYTMLIVDYKYLHW